MGKREEKAMAVLAAGGYFRKALERGHFGGEKFVTRLYTKERVVVAGVGVATRIELEKAGKLSWRACGKSSVWPEEWVINEAAVAAAGGAK